jgi:hypothetical protein
MASAEIGERVLAISHSEDDTVYVYGEGVYEGHFVPGPEAEGMAKLCREMGTTNPRIRLDSGEVVYGAECWWGPLDRARKRLGQLKVQPRSITEARAKARTGEDV